MQFPGKKASSTWSVLSPPKPKRRKVRQDTTSPCNDEPDASGSNKLQQARPAASLSAAGQAGRSSGPTSPQHVTAEPSLGCDGQVLQHEAAYIATLPCAEMYERSYMHRDTVTHVAVAQVPPLPPN